MRTAFSRISGMTAQQRTSLADEFDRVSRIAVAEPVAVVGIGCRFPGDVDGPESFWDFLVAGRNAISTVPADRWPPRPANTGADDDEVGRLRP